jgi:DNA-binding transcriptional regulator PaaX
MKNIIISEKEKKTLTEIIDDFRYSDSVPATAAKFLLAALAVGGFIFVGALVPGIVSVTKEFRGSRRYSKKQIQNAVYNLKKRKMIEIVREGKDKIKVRLTNKGKARIKEFSLENLKIKKPGHWDKKWRILIFDIPTKPKIYNQAREALRNKIKKLGFYQMQKSVWAYPYECEDEILFVAEIFQVQRHIEIITADKVMHENILKRKFGL